MKLRLTVATLLLSVTTLVPVVNGQKKVCSCKAPDTTCNANVSCSEHGCTVICGSKDGCYAKCGQDLLVTQFSLKLVKKDANVIASALSQQTGKTIEFIPRRASDRFNVDIKDDDLWSTLEHLSTRGQVKVNGEDWSKYQKLRRVALEGGKLYVDFNDISVRDALAHLSFLTGLGLRVGSGDAEKLLSISLQEVTLGEMIESIATQAGVKIEQTKKSMARK